MTDDDISKSWAPAKKIFQEVEAPQPSNKVENVEGLSPSPSRLGGPGERRKLPRRVRSGAAAENEFGAFLASQNISALER